MKKIEMVDLQSQYHKIKDEIDKSILNVVNSCRYIKGPEVQEFERLLEEYLDVKHVISCGNGTDALQIALMALNLKAEDEIIIPSFTYIATAEVIALLGLKPILVDVNNKTFNINTNEITKKITSKTKAIIPVHLFGQAANMEAVIEIAQKHNLHIIEDNAQALGAEYFFKNGITQKLGTIGDIGCTSFFPSKNLGCFGDGGAMMTNNDELAAKLRKIANHGQSVKYIHDCIGVNSRLDTIQAAILKVKLPHLNTYNDIRNKVASYYDEAFKNHPKIDIPSRVDYSNHVFHQYTLKLIDTNRTKVVNYLRSKEIPCMVYYPKPVHFQKAYQYDYKEGDFAITEELCKNVISLPIHTEITHEQLKYITKTLLYFLD